MNDLVKRAIRSRPTDAQPSMVFCEAGAIAVGGSADGWAGLLEVVVLPLLAHLDFVIAMDIFLSKHPDRQPSQDPEATEATAYYLFQAGNMTEVWVLPIRRGDQGEITQDEPWEMIDPVMTSAAAVRLTTLIQLYAETRDGPRDHRLEHDLAFVLAGRGHIVAWEQGPTS